MHFLAGPPWRGHSHDPFRRRTDRMSAWARIVAGVAVTVAAPTTGVLVTDAFAASLRQDESLERTTAVAQEGATHPTAFAENSSARALATVKWEAADGTSRTGEASVPVNTKARAQVTIWLDERGKPKQPPPPAEDIRAMSVSAGVLAGTGTSVVVLGGYQLTKLRIAALCAREWEREWAAVEPLWSGRK